MIAAAPYCIYRLRSVLTGAYEDKAGSFVREVDALAHLAYESPLGHDLYAEAEPPPLSSTEEKAYAIAKRRHGDQRYGAQPYTFHLHAVRQALCDVGIYGDELVAAWLHDVVEDTVGPDGVQDLRDDIRERFGPRVEAIVWAVTGIGQNRTERKASAYGKMRDLAGDIAEMAINVKLGDRIANMTACARMRESGLFQMYVDELPEFELLLRAHGERRLWSRLRFLSTIRWRP